MRLNSNRVLPHQQSIQQHEISAGVFTRRLFATLVVVAIGLMVWSLAKVIILISGSIVFAVILRSFASTLTKQTRLPEGWSVASVVVTLLAINTLVFLLFGAQISNQFDILALRLPESFASIIGYLANQSWGHYILQVQGSNLSGMTTQIASNIADFFGSIFQFVVWGVLMFFAGIYLASQPALYLELFMRMIPISRRNRMNEIADLMDKTLKGWLTGQLITMAIVGTLVTIGLWILGVKAAFALGLIAGLFAFIPYAGPLLATVPAILMAAIQGSMEALYAALIYGGIHLIEDNLLTPLIQAKMIKLPPVITIFSALIFSILFGPFGLLFAAPLTVACLVAIETFYIEDILGDERRWPLFGKTI
jgi:predicted PurR-regulated permease PerM